MSLECVVNPEESQHEENNSTQRKVSTRRTILHNNKKLAHFGLQYSTYIIVLYMLLMYFGLHFILIVTLDVLLIIRNFSTTRQVTWSISILVDCQ